MSWLAPWFLTALTALALPVWLHRLQARNPQRQVFSSVMLLQAEEQRLRRQKELRYRALLALRLLLLLLLVLAFAQPLWRRPAQSSTAAWHVILVDTSLSMSAGERLPQARAEALRLINALPGSERGLVASASDHAESLSTLPAGSFEQPSAMRSAVARLLPSVARLDYGAAFAGLDALLADARGTVLVDFISDCQDSGSPTRFADGLPRQSARRAVTLQLHCLDAAARPNWTVESVHAGNEGIDASVHGFNTPARTLTVSLQINDSERARQSLVVPANGVASVHFTGAALASGDNRVAVRIDAEDALAADDVHYAVLSNTPAQPVLMLSASVDALSARYVATALKADGDHYRLEQQPLSQFDAATLAHYRWLIVDDLGAADERHLALLSQFVSRGGSLLASLGPSTQLRQQLPLLGDPVLAAAQDADPLSVGAVDAAHPLLSDTRGWQGLGIARLVSVRPGADDHVLVAASNGAPLLLERQLGQGRVLVFTSTFDNDWNDLPVRPLFVSLLAQLGRYLDGRSQLRSAQTVGASLALAGAGSDIGQVIDPAGRALLSLSQTHRAATLRLDQSGFYRVYTPGQEALLAVNPDVRESDLTAMSDAAVQRWRAAAAALRSQPVVQSTAAAREQPLAPWLLAWLAVLVLVESLVANLSLQRRQPTPA